MIFIANGNILIYINIKSIYKLLHPACCPRSGQDAGKHDILPGDGPVFLSGKQRHAPTFVSPIGSIFCFAQGCRRVKTTRKFRKITAGQDFYLLELVCQSRQVSTASPLDHFMRRSAKRLRTRMKRPSRREAGKKKQRGKKSPRETSRGALLLIDPAG